jgi:hypothetical protein
MSTWLPHLRVSFGGTLGTPAAEIWANSIRFKSSPNFSATAPSDEIDSAALDVALPLMVAPIKTWIAAAPSKISNYATCTWAKLAWIKADGHQRDVATHVVEVTAPNAGNSNLIPPYYQTFALTFRTDKRRGRAHSGRIYPPMVAAALQGNGYIAPTDGDGMVGTAVTLLNALAAAIQPDGSGSAPVYPVVASPATATGPDAGGALLQRVTGIVVDLVPDVQHRRTNQLKRVETALSAVTGAVGT